MYPMAVRTEIRESVPFGPNLLLWWSTHFTDPHSTAETLDVEPALKLQSTKTGLNISLSVSSRLPAEKKAY